MTRSRERHARGDRTRGWVINTASMLGLIGLANGPCYVLAKHVKIAMIDSLIPTDEHEKGLGEWGHYGSDRGKICC